MYFTYLGLYICFGQIMHVHNGFWIEINPVSTPIELLSFQFRRQLDSKFVFDAHTIIALIASVLLYIYLAFRTYKYKKENTDIKPALLSFFVYVRNYWNNASYIINYMAPSIILKILICNDRPLYFLDCIYV